MRSRRNKKGGTNTVELAPALFILLVIVMIPAIDMLHIGVAYAFGWYANFLATREASCTGPDPGTNGTGNVAAQNAADKATATWAQTGLGRFIHAPPPVNNPVNPNYPPDVDNDGRNDFCLVTTRVQVIPMFNFPGLAAGPITFQYTTVRPLEEHNVR